QSPPRSRPRTMPRHPRHHVIKPDKTRERRSPGTEVGQPDSDRLIEDIAAAIQRAAETERRSDFDFQERVQAELAPLLAAAAPSGRKTGSDGNSDLEAASDSPAVAMVNSARWAFAYMLTLNPPKPGEWSFSPRLEFADGESHPPRIETISQDVLSTWHELAPRVTAPAAIARLEHLLFERRYKSNRERIRRTITGYLKFPELWLESRLDATAALRHALHIARRTKQDDLAQQALAAMCELAEVSLTEESPEPGVALRLIETLLEDRDPPSELENLIQMAGRTYCDAWNADHIIKYKLMFAAKNGSSTEALHAERVDLWLSAAAAAEGIVRSRHLLEAVKVARESGIIALVGRATSQLQAMRAEDMKLQEVSVGARLYSIEVDRALAPIIQADNVSEALIAFAQFGPVSGNALTNRATVEAQAREFPISNLFPVHRLGGDNMPRYFVSSEEDKAEYRLAQHEEMNISLGSGILAEGLVRIAQKFGIPSEAELAGHFMMNPSDVFSPRSTRTSGLCLTGTGTLVQICG
ncbi:hypothetical protein, partial [Microtetraspora malaysiensis]